MHIQRFAAIAVGLIGGLLWLGGCSTTPSHESTMDERQDQALKKPFDYSTDSDTPSISGGGIGDFDQKAFDKDLNHVLNP